MVGGGNRRNEGSYADSTNNVFAALESLRRKKKTDKEKGSSKGSVKASAGKSKETIEEKPQLFWAPTPLTAKSWADVDDEDDDDYYATTAPPQALWVGSSLTKEEETQEPELLEETESEDDLLDEGDDDIVEENGHEQDANEQPEPKEIIQVPVESFPAPKETERQLSKKERKKKELAELDAILADFGLNPKENPVDEPSDAFRGKKDESANGELEKKDNGPTESKNVKKKKKKDKDKASKEIEFQDHPNSANTCNGIEVTVSTAKVEEDASAIDVKERLKKMANAKKKKSNKDLDAAARAATAEAAARSAKLAAAKKKEKNHYNQQPIR